MNEFSCVLNSPLSVIRLFALHLECLISKYLARSF